MYSDWEGVVVIISITCDVNHVNYYCLVLPSTNQVGCVVLQCVKLKQYCYKIIVLTPSLAGSSHQDHIDLSHIMQILTTSTNGKLLSTAAGCLQHLAYNHDHMKGRIRSVHINSFYVVTGTRNFGYTNLSI